MIKLGPGGTAGLGYEAGLTECNRLGLSALEVEFTHGVNMKLDSAKEIGELAKKLNISLSVHAPYFINLASEDKAKLQASIKRIMDSCERAHYLGATHVVYHSGFFQKQDPKDVKEKITEATTEIIDKIKEKGYKTEIAPELTGKPTQFGSIGELLQLRKDTGCNLTIDFAHERARNQGKVDYDEIFKQLKGIKHIHSHFSGIEWTAKGERRHLITEAKDIKELLNSAIKNKADLTIINESPDPIGDAEKSLKILKSLK